MAYLIVIIWMAFGPWAEGSVAAQAVNTTPVNAEESVQDEREGSLPDWLERPDDSVSAPVQAGVSYWMIMAFLLALLLLSLWVFNRLSKKAVPVSGVGIRVLARHYLSPRSFLCVVEVDGERLLLGVSDGGGVSLITYLDHGREFKEIIRREIGEEPRTVAQQGSRQEYEGFMRELEGQIRDLKAAIQKRISDV